MRSLVGTIRATPRVHESFERVFNIMGASFKLATTFNEANQVEFALQSAIASESIFSIISSS